MKRPFAVNRLSTIGWESLVKRTMLTLLLVRLVRPLVLSQFTRQTLRRYLSTPNNRDLVVLKELVESGKLTPVIDRTYQLHETPAALRAIEAGHTRGKVVVVL